MSCPKCTTIYRLTQRTQNGIAEWIWWCPECGATMEVTDIERQRLNLPPPESTPAPSSSPSQEPTS
jgi:hypothetical protein